VAFCHCLEHFQGTRASGEHEAFWTRSTVGLRKVDGTWMITHEHSSMPIPMDEQDES
jgi:ketosteroid isomerase-like protein